uniref:DUF3883 domain-containing protein n=1 Tax=Bursaphelenchus xylophilus TaxID=6326 RepID=A0A1I7SEK2_BURXY
MRNWKSKIVMVEDVSSDKPITQADEIGNAMANMRGQYRIESEKYIRLISKPLVIFYHMCSGQTVCRELRVEGAEKHQRIELFEKGNIVSLTKCARNN